MASDLDAKSLMQTSLQGASVEKVPELEAAGVWHFVFTSGWLMVECPWRAVSTGRIVLGSADHGHQFGLPELVDAVSRVLALFQKKTVVSVDIDGLTSDLTIQFTEDLRIDVFNSSAGYEGWHYCDRQGLELVGAGGGRLLMCYGERKDWKTIYGD
jgi:hypothetical protein